MKHFKLAALASATAALVAACGGGSDSGPDRGKLRETPQVLATLTAAQIDAGTAASGLQAISGKAKCDVKVVALDYDTVGVKNGEAANASGVLLVPAGACAAVRAPLVAYAKGTDLQRPRTLANPQDGETALLIAMYAAQGYAVVATDYLGYAKSTYSFHPYLHADSEASSVLDSIRAARNAAPQVGGQFSDKLFITGYSQGGHASAAAQRAAQADGDIKVTAGAHLAGPYNLSGSLKVPDAIAGYQFFVPFLVSTYQKIYGNVYAKPSDIYNAPYADYIEDLLPSATLTSTTLITTGRLPGGTPNQARDALYKPAFLADTRDNPNSALSMDARKNDLLGWTPTAPVLLCGGAGDPTVSPAVHQRVLKADFDARGVQNVTSVDVDPQIRAIYGPPPAPGTPAFATYYGSYHGGYEPPLCAAQARAFFAKYQ
ncbi:MAG: lipase family protein [Burkholderiaceae bacterium]